MVQHRNKVVLYTAAVCNLNCHYCAIDKNPALVEIDRMLEESFKGDYYINFMKDIFPDPNQLTGLETWGGEPFIGMHRIYHIIEDMIDWFPNFNSFFSSTNLVYPQFHERFYGLLNLFGKHPERKFTVILQLSSDGFEEITDRSRGIGVTSKIDLSLRQLFSELDVVLPQNVKLEMHFKPTLDSETIRMLQSEEDVIRYYQYFEKYFSLFDKLVESKNAHIHPSVPNTASPGMHDIEDGKLFAEFCRISAKVQKDNVEKKYFKYYNKILPYAANPYINDVRNISSCGFMCGSCREIIGLLPNRMISGCHGAFVDLIAEYKNRISTHCDNKVIDSGIFSRDSFGFFCFPEEKLALREVQIENYFKPMTSARLSSATALIQTMAYSHQIDKKFIDPEEALKAADYIHRNAANCLKDNLAVSGTMTVIPIGIIRLLLNGAYDILVENS